MMTEGWIALGLLVGLFLLATASSALATGREQRWREIVRENRETIKKLQKRLDDCDFQWKW